MRSLVSIIAAPTLCLGLLGAIVWENGRHAKPADAVPFHARAKAAVESWPVAFEGWAEKDEPLPPAAIQLLKPNAYFCRQYSRPRVPQPRTASDWSRVSLMVVQCRDPIDMSGHYPPNCYPRNGYHADREVPRAWPVPGLPGEIRGTEYHFSGGTFAAPEPLVVYNFFVLPGRGFVSDMGLVREASGDYQRRHFGATQVQVVFSGLDLDPGARDKVFADLLSNGAGALSTLNPTGL